MNDQTTYQTTVVFADVSGSSKLYKEVGDAEANRRITDIINRVMEAVKKNRGVVIKTIGDEVMCHFRDANDACNASIDIQKIGQQTLPMRIGMAWGQVIEKDNDLFSHAVNDAAAVAKIARGKQIIVTEDFKKNLSGENAKKLSLFDEVKLKGGNELTKIFRIDWEIPTGTNSIPKQTVIMTAIGSIQTQVVISFNRANGVSDSITLTSKDVPLHIGRDGACCQLVMESPLSSRDHCHIDYQYGKFVLVDHSTNGTYLKEGDKPEIQLRRQESPLVGKGEIGLGEPISNTNHFIIRYYS